MAITIQKGELRVTDTLNYEVFKNMTDENRKEMVKWRMKKILNSDVVNMYNGTMHKEIPMGDKTDYKVVGVFTILDWHINKRGSLTANMRCKRNGKDIDVDVNKIVYKIK